MTCRVEEIIALVEEMAPPAWAEEWDNVGLQVGSPRAEVSAVLVSLDAAPAVMAEAVGMGAGLLVCHHPLIFRPLRRLLTDEPAGLILRDALVSGVAVYAAHTNLDVSPYGVNAALAERLGLADHRPLPGPRTGWGFKLVTFLPPEHLSAVSSALFGAGAGRIGEYTGCSFRVEGTGTFTPGPGSHPVYGDATGANEVREARLEVTVERESLEEAVEALLAAHPYEEPAYDVYPLSNQSPYGLGRVGNLPAPVSLAELADRCCVELGNPAVRLAGDPGGKVERVAVCGGSGAKLAAQALEAGVEVLITGDVGLHDAVEAEAMGLAMIDAGHYHTERPVVPYLASVLEEGLGEAGLDVEVRASLINTCPWRNGGSE